MSAPAPHDPSVVSSTAADTEERVWKTAKNIMLGFAALFALTFVGTVLTGSWKLLQLGILPLIVGLATSRELAKYDEKLNHSRPAIVVAVISAFTLLLMMVGSFGLMSETSKTAYVKPAPSPKVDEKRGNSDVPKEQLPIVTIPGMAQPSATPDAPAPLPAPAVAQPVAPVAPRRVYVPPKPKPVLVHPSTAAKPAAKPKSSSSSDEKKTSRSDDEDLSHYKPPSNPGYTYTPEKSSKSSSDVTYEDPVLPNGN